MPRQYEAIRDKLAAKGMSYDEAQAHAARIYNSQHPGAPVTNHPQDEQVRRALNKRKPS